MSDFSNGVGVGLAGSNGIGSLAKTMSLAPYLSAMQEQKARSQAAVEALNAAKLDEINRRHTANKFWAGIMGVPVEALGGYSPEEVSQWFSNTREGQMMSAAGMLGGKQPTGSMQPTGSVQPIGGATEAKARSEANIQRNAPVLKQLIQDSGAIAHALKGGSMYQRTNDGAAFNTFYGTSEVSDKEVRNLYRQEKQAGIAKDRAQAAHYRTSSGGGTSGKPLPIGAVKMQQDHLEAIGASASLVADLEAVERQIATDGIDLGPMNNAINTGRNFLGLSSEQSRNFASLEANLERLRNESLRLNKGVQTEGDAQRAGNELVKNLNDPQVVRKRLRELININRRAIELRKNELNVLRSNYGHAPLPTEKAGGVRTSVVGNVLIPGAVDSGYEYLGGDPSQPSNWRKL